MAILIIEGIDPDHAMRDVVLAYADNVQRSTQCTVCSYQQFPIDTIVDVTNNVWHTTRNPDTDINRLVLVVTKNSF